MNVRQTSIDAYTALYIEGKIAPMQELIYNALLEFPEITDRELSGMTDLEINNVTGRRNELVKLGLVESIGKRSCSVSGYNALVWSVCSTEVKPSPLVEQAPIITVREMIMMLQEHPLHHEVLARNKTTGKPLLNVNIYVKERPKPESVGWLCG